MKRSTISLIAGLLVTAGCTSGPETPSRPATPSRLTAASQTATFTRTVIDPNPPDAQHLEKAIAYFTSTQYPSYYLGTTSGGYIYDTTTGQRITVDQDGYHYERARSFTYGGDALPGIIASVNGQTVWYQNPGNWPPFNVNSTWGKQVILNSWCHDVEIADIDGDGKQDVICSGTSTFNQENGQIAFQNSNTSWSPMTLFSPAGDGIAIFNYNGRPNIVGCNGTSLYWYANPGGAASRNPSNWTAHFIGDCTEGVSIRTLNVGNREIVVQASNETGASNAELWPSGLAYFDPGANPFGSWSKVIIDGTYRDVHEIASDNLGGVPFITVGEQSQASSACNGDGLNDHPSVSGCRVAVFPWAGSGFGTPTLLANLGSQNQAMLQVNGVEWMVGANHNAFNDVDKPLYLWKFTLSTTGGGGIPLAVGTYNFQDSSGNAMDLGWTQNQSWANSPFVYLYLPNNNPWQQLIYTGSKQLQSVASSQYLFNSNNTLGVGSTGGSFNIIQSGNEYTIQDVASGLYLDSPGALGPPNKLGLSSTPAAWTAMPISTGGATKLAAGTYTFQDGAGNAMDLGWSQNQSWANNPFVFLYSYNGNSWQQLSYTSGNQLQSVASGRFVFNSGNTLGVGTTAGTFNIVQSGNGYTLQDTASGLFVNSPGAVGPPNKLGLSASATVWTAILH